MDKISHNSANFNIIKSKGMMNIDLQEKKRGHLKHHPKG